MKSHVILILASFLAKTHGETNVRLSGVETEPYGPFYCQARCLATCLETNLANSLDACSKYCPPFDASMPCPANNQDCWRNCGIAPSPTDKSPPPSMNFLMAQHVSSPDRRMEDPFTIELTWDPVPTASLYIVEMYPLNRQPRPGEKNFFRAITAFPTYMVRKEDECTVYDVRVMPVNTFGIGSPQYTRIDAPRPTMTGGDGFYVRNIRRGPSGGNFVVATIDYAIPPRWPIGDVEFVGIRVKATECRGQKRVANATGDWYPFYDIRIEKTPAPKIQLSFTGDVVQMDCLFQMRVSALASRCNTTTYFDSNGGAIQDSIVGVNFRINCMTAEGFSCTQNQDSSNSFLLPPNPSFILPPVDSDITPVPPPLPSFVRTPNKTIMTPIIPNADPFSLMQLPQSPTDANGPLPGPMAPQWPGLGANGPLPNVDPDIPVDILSGFGSEMSKMHPFLIDYLAINGQLTNLASCEIETLQVRPTPSVLGPSFVDLSVFWMERSPITQRTPAYFLIRYGPVVRALVDDNRQPHKILPGHETVLRSGRSPMVPQFGEVQVDRQITVQGVPKGSLLSFQVCAIYNPNIESLITWDSVHNQLVDLAAVQSPPEASQLPKGSITSLPPMATDESPPSAFATEGRPLPDSNPIPIPFSIDPNSSPNQNSIERQDRVDNQEDKQTGPVIVRIGILDGRPQYSTTWTMLLGGVFLALVMAILVFACVLRIFSTRKRGLLKKTNIAPVSTVPIAVITKTHIQPFENKQFPDAAKEIEKIALP